METATCPLADRYTDALQILRTIDIRDFRTGRDLNIDNPENQVIQGDGVVLEQYAQQDLHEYLTHEEILAMQDAIENNAYDDYREITSLHQVYDENMGGLFGKHRIFGKHSLFHRLIDKIRQHKGLRQKLLKVSSKAGEWLVKHLLGHVAPNVADKIADGIDTLAQKKIEKIDAEEGAMG